MANVESIDVESEEVTYKLEVTIPKTGRSFSLEIDRLPKNIYAAIMTKGSVDLMSRGLTKIGTKDEDGEKLTGSALEAAQEAATEIVERNLEAMYSGEMSVRGGGKRKVAGAVKNRAMQDAKRIVKAQIKAEGERIGDYSGKEITLAAEELLEDHPELLEEAAKKIAEEEKKVKDKNYIKIESNGKSKLVSKMRKDPKRVAANEAKKVRNPKPRGRKGETRLNA
jgi:hypothetical protein